MPLGDSPFELPKLGTESWIQSGFHGCVAFALNPCNTIRFNLSRALGELNQIEVVERAQCSSYGLHPGGYGLRLYRLSLLRWDFPRGLARCPDPSSCGPSVLPIVEGSVRCFSINTLRALGPIQIYACGDGRQSALEFEAGVFSYSFIDKTACKDLCANEPSTLNTQLAVSEDRAETTRCFDLGAI